MNQLIPQYRFVSLSLELIISTNSSFLYTLLLRPAVSYIYPIIILHCSFRCQFPPHHCHLTLVNSPCLFTLSAHPGPSPDAIFFYIFSQIFRTNSAFLDRKSRRSVLFHIIAIACAHEQSSMTIFVRLTNCFLFSAVL